MRIIKKSLTRGKKYGIQLYSEITEAGQTLYHIDDLTNMRPCGGTYNMRTKEEALTEYARRKEAYKKYSNINLIDQEI